jgi:hypothetical protein
MSLPIRLFQTTYPARSAFGVNNAVQNAGDFILQKKAKRSYCKASNNVKTQSDLLLLRKSNYLKNKCQLYSFNKSNLNVNLFTKMNLQDVSVITNTETGVSPTPIDIPCDIPPYISYTIDPSGVLFGNTLCGINNYQNFIVYNPPYISINYKKNQYDPDVNNYINSL